MRKLANLAVVWGLILVVLGGVFVFMGYGAKGEIREGLAFEEVKTGKDGELFGVPNGTLVQDAKTAMAQANTIHYHSLTGDKKVENGKIVGGTGYAKMAKDSKERATYLDGLTLRTSLMLAMMGFRIADFIMGVGAIQIFIGLGGIFLVAPALRAKQAGAQAQAAA